MTRILFLSQLLPYPPDAGPKIRSYYVLRHLAQNHRVTLLAFSRPDDTLEAIQHLREFCEEVVVVLMHRSLIRNIYDLVASLITGKSFIIRRDFLPEMAWKVDQLVNKSHFDAIHADQLWMAQYALRVKEKALDATLVLDEHNACFQVIQRFASGTHNPIKRILFEHEWRKLRAYEAHACSCFDHVVTVTEEDGILLQDLTHYKVKKTGQLGLKAIIQDYITIPICVDTQSFVPVKPREKVKDILHLGTMFWLPNIDGVLWFAKEVWPKVIAQIPETTFTIVGKNPPSKIRALSQPRNGKSHIQVTGYIPDPTPYLERTGVFIVPLLSGGGMRVKIVDAWRWGLPIISTTIGAEGIHYVDGENILIADDPDSFAQSVIQVLTEPQIAERLRINGRKWVELNYDWRTVYSDWDMIYK